METTTTTAAVMDTAPAAEANSAAATLDSHDDSNDLGDCGRRMRGHEKIREREVSITM